MEVYGNTINLRLCLISFIVTLKLALTKFLVFFMFKFLFKYISYYFHVFVIKKYLLPTYLRFKIRHNERERGSQTPAWLINYYFLNKHTVLTFIRGIIVCTNVCFPISFCLPIFVSIYHILVICI